MQKNMVATDGFTIKRVEKIDELQCILTEAVHNASGAEVIHIGCDDPENLFCLSFRTYPDSSNGVAHILEHTVLCGSKKYPIKDPFFCMMRRSLNTFMNAMTGADFTCYPAASMVKKDFYNLLDVYVDAVFSPLLKELSFFQEGHRLEFAKGDDPTSPLEFKGIVFNEMKGVLTSADSRVQEEFSHALFPNLTYGVNSGGDPKVIPELTYEGLIDFHRTYYHPSRCLYFFYGDIPLDEHLKYLDEKVLKGVKKVDPIPCIPPQPRFNYPRVVKAFYPIGAEEDLTEKTIHTFGWLTCPIADQLEILAISILEIVLMGHDGALLKQKLLQSGLCKEAYVYCDAEMSEVPFALLLKGCREENLARLEELIFATLKEVVKSGLDRNLVEGALHQVEFQRSEISGDYGPFGLNLFMRAGLLKQHGVDPEKGLKIHSLFKELGEKIQDPRYLTGLIEKHLLNNQHFVKISLVPDRDLEKREKEEEQGRLKEIADQLEPDEVAKIVSRAKVLEEFQDVEEEQELDCLPKLTLADVPKKIRDYPLTSEKHGNLEIFSHHCFTNQILYADLVWALPKVLEEDLPYLRLFSRFLNQVGAGGKNYQDWLNEQQEHTGGIGIDISLNVQADDPFRIDPTFQIWGKALYRKSDRLLPMLRTMIETPDFSDRNRIGELLTKHFSSMQNSISSSPMGYAKKLAGSGLTPAAHMSEKWSGLSYYHTVKSILERFEKDPNHLIDKLKEMQNLVLSPVNPHMILACDERGQWDLERDGFHGFGEFGRKEQANGVVWPRRSHFPKVESQGVMIPTPVAFNCMAMKTVPYTHELSALLAVGSNLMDNLVLHKKVREQGGAYGAGAGANTLQGTFTFHSYRDPNLSRTVKAFHDGVARIMKGSFSARDLEEAKLECIQKLDSPISPGSRASASYSWLREGRTPERRQVFRDKLLGATKKEIAEAVKEVLEPVMAGATLVSFAGKEMLEAENEKVKKVHAEGLVIRSV